MTRISRAWIPLIIAKEVDETGDFIKDIEKLCKPHMPRIISIRAVLELSRILSTLAKLLSAGFGISIEETAANILELKKVGMLKQDGGDMVPANYPDATFYINQT